MKEKKGCNCTPPCTCNHCNCQTDSKPDKFHSVKLDHFENESFLKNESPVLTGINYAPSDEAVINAKFYSPVFKSPMITKSIGLKSDYVCKRNYHPLFFTGDYKNRTSRIGSNTQGKT